MSVAYWCVLIGALLPYLPIGVAKFSPGSGYDNARPRQSEAQMTGLRARAIGAHHNGFEAFPLFAVAVLAAHQLGQAGLTLDRLAMGWVAARLVYTAIYCLGAPTLRSVVWTAATALALAIFTLPVWA